MEENINKKSLWRIGKDEYKKFMSIKLSRKTNGLSFFMGLLLTGIIVFPIACLVFEIIELYWFNKATMFLFLAIAWGLLMLCNGLSNYISIKFVKAYEKDMENIQAIDDKAVLFYQCFNIGFGIFILFILTFFGLSV